MAKMSASRMMRYSSPSTVTSVPEYFPYKNFVADFHFHRDFLSVIRHLAGADSDDFSDNGLFLRGIRKDNATLCPFLCRARA